MAGEPRGTDGRAADHDPLAAVLRPPLLSRPILGVALGAIPVVGSVANANWLVPWSDHANEQRAAATGTTRAKEPPDPRREALTQITRSGGAFVASSYIFGMLDPLHPQFQLFTFLLGFIGITYFGWLPLFLPELFPTRVRATGTGISFNTGRVVAAVVVLSAGFILHQFGGDYAQVGLWSGMIYAVGMLVIWFVPRQTAGRLED